MPEVKTSNIVSTPVDHSIFHDKLEGRCEKILKIGDTHPGDCISTDHYILAIQGHLLHMFGCEWQG